MYRVQVAKKAKKNLERIPLPFRSRILDALIRLSNEPYLGEPLQGNYKGRFSLHIHPYRVVYEVFKNVLLVYVVSINHRKDTYR